MSTWEDKYEIKRRNIRIDNILGIMIVIGSPESIELGIKKMMEEYKLSRKYIIDRIIICLQNMGGDDLGHIKFITLEYLVKVLKIDDIINQRTGIIESKPFYYRLVEPPNPRSMSYLLNHCHLDIQNFIDYDLKYTQPSLLKTMFKLKTIFLKNDEESFYDMILKSQNGKTFEKSFSALKQIVCNIPFWHTEQKMIWISFYKHQPKNNFISWLPKDIIKFIFKIIFLSRINTMEDIVSNHEIDKELEQSMKKHKSN